MNFIAPRTNLSSFTCPYCDTLAEQYWDYKVISKSDFNYYFTADRSNEYEVISLSTCRSCGEFHIWIGDNMVVPPSINVPLPSEDMPEKIKDIYNEAREVFEKSPRASAALLRLGLQHLCKYLGGEGKNINDDIAFLVKNGLNSRLQQAFDIVRITGNNAVHPGEVNLSDNPDIAYRLFGLMNFIVENMITQLNAINSFFEDLPEGAKKAIEKRDLKII